MIRLVLGVLAVKHKQRAVYLFVISLTALLVALGIYTNAPQKQFIRFHVVANSDSPEDQALKLRIRDKLLEKFGKEFANIDSIEAGRDKIKSSMDEIERIASLEIERSGKSYPVQVQFGRFSFPTKAYGHLVLPAGKYEALKVVIGNGEGSNWWCVMFPPLCFIDISHGVARQNEGVTKSDSASQVDIAIEVKRADHQQKEAVKAAETAAPGASAGKENKNYTESYEPEYREFAADERTSSGIADGADEQEDAEGEPASVSYDNGGDIVSSDKIEYRWKVAEWLKISGDKVKRLFSFLSFWDR